MDCIRALLVVFLITGCLAPRMTFVLAQLFPGVQIMVICTGNSLITLIIGADGIPVEDAEITEHSCVMADTITLAEIEPPFWASLGRDFDHRFAIHESTQVAIVPLSVISPSRAPPVLV